MTGVLGCIGDGQDSKRQQVTGEVTAGLMMLCGLGYLLPVSPDKLWPRSDPQLRLGVRHPAHSIIQLCAGLVLGQSGSVGAAHLLTATHITLHTCPHTPNTTPPTAHTHLGILLSLCLSLWLPLLHSFCLPCFSLPLCEPLSETCSAELKQKLRASLVAQMVKNLPTMKDTQVWSLG